MANLPPTWVIHIATRRPAHNAPIHRYFLYGFLQKDTKSMWIGVLWAGLRAAMWITHVGGKCRHGLLEKSLRLLCQKVWAPSTCLCCFIGQNVAIWNLQFFKAVCDFIPRCLCTFPAKPVVRGVINHCRLQFENAALAIASFFGTLSSGVRGHF